MTQDDVFTEILDHARRNFTGQSTLRCPMHILRAQFNIRPADQVCHSEQRDKRRAEHFFNTLNNSQIRDQRRSQVTRFGNSLVHFPVSSHNWGMHDCSYSISESNVSASSFIHSVAQANRS